MEPAAASYCNFHLMCENPLVGGKSLVKVCVCSMREKLRLHWMFYLKLGWLSVDVYLTSLSNILFKSPLLHENATLSEIFLLWFLFLLSRVQAHHITVLWPGIHLSCLHWLGTQQAFKLSIWIPAALQYQNQSWGYFYTLLLSHVRVCSYWSLNISICEVGPSVQCWDLKLEAKSL